MKSIALLLALSTVVSWGTGTSWVTVRLPTHVLYVDEGSSGGMTEVQCVSSSTDTYERKIELMNSSYIPHHANWNIPADTNLITLYKIRISGSYDVDTDPKKPKLIITIDCSNAVQPKGYPFSVDEVVEKVKACVKLNLNNDSIIVVPKAEKDNTGQPANSSETKSEDKDKTESE